VVVVVEVLSHSFYLSCSLHRSVQCPVGSAVLGGGSVGLTVVVGGGEVEETKTTKNSRKIRLKTFIQYI